MNYNEDGVYTTMSVEVAAFKRDSYIKHMLLPALQRTVFKYENVASATLFVAQYWDDEADDAVHMCVVTNNEPLPVYNLTGSSRSKGDVLLKQYTIFSHCDLGYNDLNWDGNVTAITLWAAWTNENCSQDDDYDDSYSPAVTILRDGSLIWHPQIRPYLDGVISIAERAQTFWDVEIVQ
jgi:hypothetical protein